MTTLQKNWRSFEGSLQVLGEGKVEETFGGGGEHLVLKPPPSKSAFAPASKLFPWPQMHLLQCGIMHAFEYLHSKITEIELSLDFSFRVNF